MSNKLRKIKKKNEKLSLGEVNEQLMKVSDQIEAKMNYLQQKYNFKIDYAFKPITVDELKSKNTKPLS